MASPCLPEWPERPERVLDGICLAPRVRTCYGKITKEQLGSLVPMDHAAMIDHRPDLTLQKEQLIIAPESTSTRRPSTLVCVEG